jgi:hypothetical protein
MPALMGKEKKQQKLIADLPNVFRTIMKKYGLAPGDFPVSRILYCVLKKSAKHCVSNPFCRSCDCVATLLGYY